MHIPTIEIYFKDKNEELKISAKGFFLASLNYTFNKNLEKHLLNGKIGILK